MEIYLEYLRKSREDIELEKKDREAKTLERHKSRLKIISEAAGKPVYEDNIYEEVVSGDSISNRPEVQRLLKAIENPNIKGVWVVDVQRLCRGDLSDQDRIIKTFKYTNTLILTPEKEFDLSKRSDEEYLIDKLSFSRKEYEEMKRRATEGRRDSVGVGKFIGSISAFGYERYRLKGERGWSLKIVDEQAEIVKLIFQKCLNGMGTLAIASYLNKLKIPSPSGKLWRKNGIREMLHNEVYCGYVSWQKRKYTTYIENGIIKRKIIRQKNGEYLKIKGRHEAIISEDDFQLVQEKLKTCSTKYVKSKTELKNPMAGILRCSECGRVMARRSNKNSSYYKSSTNEKILYDSKDIIYCTHKCNTVSHTLEYVEVALIESLKDWLDQNKKIIKEYEQNSSVIINEVINTINILKQNLSKEEQKIERLRDLLEDGIYDKKTYLERSKLINDNITSINNQILKITKENEEIKMQKTKLLIPKVMFCVENYFTMNTKEKNEILHSILEKVVYTKTQRKRDSDLTLDLYMKI